MIELSKEKMDFFGWFFVATVNKHCLNRDATQIKHQWEVTECKSSLCPHSFMSLWLELMLTPSSWSFSILFCPYCIFWHLIIFNSNTLYMISFIFQLNHIIYVLTLIQVYIHISSNVYVYTYIRLISNIYNSLRLLTQYIVNCNHI